MRIAYRSLAAVTLLAAASLQAQAPPPPQAPKPGPEHQKLAYFAGRWTTAGDMKPGPMGPGGKMTMTNNCEWFAGGFYLVCRAEGMTPGGEMRSMGILGYNPERKRYTYYGIDNSGMPAEPSYGEVAGDTWTWEGESQMGGQTVKGRYVIKQTSPDSYAWKWEMAMGAGPWTVVGEGTDTRVK